MPKVSYPDDFKLRAVALASVRGVPEAAKTLGIGEDTLRAWQRLLPYDSALQLAADLALSELTVELAEQKRKGRLAVDAGILLDKVRRYPRPLEAAPVKDAAEPGSPCSIRSCIRSISTKRARSLSAPDAPGPAVPECMRYLEGLGDLKAWRVRRDQERHAEMLEQLERNRRAAAEWAQRSLDEETRALIRRAEEWLAAHSESKT